MGSLRLSTHRKNEKRHKYGFYPFCIPHDTVSVLPILLPLDERFFAVSLSVTTYASLPANIPASLRARIYGKSKVSIFGSMDQAYGSVNWWEDLLKT